MIFCNCEIRIRVCAVGVSSHHISFALSVYLAVSVRRTCHPHLCPNVAHQHQKLPTPALDIKDKAFRNVTLCACISVV